MGSLLILLGLSVVMALTSFLAGALPLSMTLSQSQLRLISSIGVGILVGTSLIVIIPEGIEAIATASEAAHAGGHKARQSLPSRRAEVVWKRGTNTLGGNNEIFTLHPRDGPTSTLPTREDDKKPDPQPPHSDTHLPTFEIGFSLMLGFSLMFLIDRLPRHATERFHSAPATRHISLDNLASSSSANDDDLESSGFLSSLTPSPKQSRGLATTTGLVIHAAADGIAMGASATTSNMKLGLIIFVAIMVHKAPAAFGLTSVLLKQGLSKRAARGHLIVFSAAAPFGALGTYVLISVLGGSMEGPGGEWWMGMILLFSAGTFLYVAMHAMQEDSNPQGSDHHHGNGVGGGGYQDGVGNSAQRKQAKPQMRDTLATVGGMMLPLLTQFGHHH
ncbi:Zinc/iron permease [Podospora conica]|nr:Zinc/iron permease [Schizothecium conicum]